MRKLAAAALVLLGILVAIPAVSRAEGSLVRVGGGALYWVAVDDVDEQDFDDKGLSWFASVQVAPIPLIKLEFDVEMLPKHFMGAPERIWAPQAYVVVGGFVYAAAGIGKYYSDGEWADDPFYALRAGFDIPLGPISLDLNANYRFEGKFKSSDVKSDTIFLGAAVRYGF